MFRKRANHAKSRQLPALLLLLCGCAPIPAVVRDIPDSTALELDQTPFYSQERFQCGPAALTTVLAMSGADVTFDEIVDKVYLPGRQGSLQAELMAATRTEGRLPFIIEGTLATILAELESGRPILVLQNLGVAAIPRWHYAVVVGIDTDRGEVVLRSGTDPRRVTAIGTFLQTWRRGDYWAMVTLRPDELPASANQGRYFSAIAALEEAGRLDEAALAWRTARHEWPNEPVALFGLANVQFALGNFAAAETTYRALLDLDGSLVVARNNLAIALAEQGSIDAGIEEIGIALKRNQDSALDAELRDTESTIRSMLKDKQ